MASTIDEYRTQLTNVKAAIVKAENAQSYSVGGRAKANAALETLYARQDKLEARIDRMERGGLDTKGITTLE